MNQASTVCFFLSPFNTQNPYTEEERPLSPSFARLPLKRAASQSNSKSRSSLLPVAEEAGRIQSWETLLLSLAQLFCCHSTREHRREGGGSLQLSQCHEPEEGWGRSMRLLS